MNQSLGRMHLDSGTRRTALRAPRGLRLAQGLGVAAVLVAILVVTTPIAQAGPLHASLTYGPPFAGKVTTARTLQYLGCGTTGKITKLPKFALSTGVETLAEKTTAKPCASPLGYNTADTTGYAGMWTKTFTGLSGFHQVVAHWTVHWSSTIKANLGPHQANGQASASTLVRAVLYLVDETNGTYLNPANAWSSYSWTGNGTLVTIHSATVSIFVNQLQFGPGEDLDRYPRTLDADLAMCAEEGARLVFAPSAAEMYPGGEPEVTVDPGPAGQVLEGKFRPGFFGGVLTVVLKLFNLTRPDVAVFGQKDAQQLALVRRMASDLNLGVVIESVPIVRDADGLAVSSRNAYLSPGDRTHALALSRALRAGAARAADGVRPVLAAAGEILAESPAVAVDYLELVDPATFAPVPAGRAGPAVLVVAATVGGTRLIDNVPVALAGGVHAADH